jgi:hypothetical protein
MLTLTLQYLIMWPLAYNTVGIQPGKLSYKLRMYCKGRALQISCTAPFKSLAICFPVIVETQAIQGAFSHQIVSCRVHSLIRLSHAGCILSSYCLMQGAFSHQIVSYRVHSLISLSHAGCILSSDCLQTWTLLFWPRTILVSSLKLTEDHWFCHFLQQNSSPFSQFNGEIVISYIFCKIKHDYLLYNSAINQWTLPLCL